MNTSVRIGPLLFLPHPRFLVNLSILLVLYCCGGCHWSRPGAIAVIPRTSGTMLWNPEDRGAQTAAVELGEKIYWNASTREDDVDGQIRLVEQVSRGKYQGLVLAPDHSLALITPVRRALATGLPIVIVGSPLPISANVNLAYVLNDEEAGGRLAAQRVATLIHDQGRVALIGIDPDITGIMERAENFKRFLRLLCPHVHVVVQRMGSFNFAHEQEAVQEVLRTNPDLNVIVALNSTSTRGAVSSIQGGPWSHTVKVIGFDPDSLEFANPSLDSVVMQDTRGMGERAVRLIHARIQGEPLPARTVFEPILVTRENVATSEVQEMIYTDWRPGAAHLRRAGTP